ncbi:MAG: MerR family transcriptional regulator [Treponema sp.]|nr:MerR family transcriptional regulator [Candidatus Treponema caballi]
MKEFYTVGEIAKIYNVSTDTLRYYDKIGLLKPWLTGGNGYRYYSKAQFETISTIMLLRSMETPIETLSSALNGSSPSGITDALDQYVSNVDEQIRQLTDLKRDAVRLKKNISDVCFSEDVSVEEVPELYVFSKPFGQDDELDIENIRLVNALAQKDWTTRAGIISTITRENLMAHKFHTYDRYGYLSENPVSVSSEFFQVIPPRTCIVGTARVHSVEHAEMDDVYMKCLDYAAQNGWRVSDDAIERNILSLYAGNPSNPEMFFKVYIPVERT